MDTTVFRTWDEDLRRARYAVLLEAARKAEATARKLGLELKVTGSLSRGEVHPWSDLDLVIAVIREDVPDAWDAAYKIREASGLLYEDQVDAVFEAEVIEPLKKGMLGSAVPVSDIPLLGDLPDPELALPRSAVAIETGVTFVKKYLKDIERFPEDDARLQKLVREAAFSRSRDMLHARTITSMKRLAVFQDGGQSAWLYDSEDTDALKAMLDRLSEPADEPFERPAAITPKAAEIVYWLLAISEWGLIDDDEKTAEQEKMVLEAIPAFKEWAGHLREISSLTETHGLKPGR